ncbi:hypothetical protein VCHE16_2213, partial [Vibrio paracholerae HE-16]
MQPAVAASQADQLIATLPVHLGLT